MPDLKPILPRLGLVIRMLASDSPGETIAAVEGMRRLLEGQGATFHDLADLIELPEEDRREQRDYGHVPRWANMDNDERRKWLDVALSGFGVLDEWQVRHVSDVSRMLRAGREIPERKVSVIDHAFLKLWTRRMIP